MDSERTRSSGSGGRRDAQRLAAAHSRLNAMFGELFDLLVELDTDEARRANAMTDAASWLHYDLGIDPKTARAWVRAAKALANLPEIANAFRSGAVSLDEVLVLCRYADPENSAALLGLTREVAVEDLPAAIREYLEVPARKKRQDPRPELHMWWSETALHLRGEIPGADGVLVETALRRLACKAPLDPTTGLYRPPAYREAEALIQMASESVGEDRDVDRATIVVHVAAEDLAALEDNVSLAGLGLSRDDFFRLSCDARVQPAIDDETGLTIGIGRASRQIPGWLRRAMDKRDGGCRFPGCRRTRWTHGHHIRHWAEGGPTNLDNLVTLCGFHHRLIHRDRWRLTGNPNRELTFINKFGSVHQPARPRFDPGHPARLLEGIERRAARHLQLLEAVG